MNKTKIKNFAIEARVQLIEAVKGKASEYKISENGKNNPKARTVNGRLLNTQEKKQRSQLILQIQEKGFQQTMEEAAYALFRRLIALRYMDVNCYLPLKYRVFTDKSGAFEPEILKESLNIEFEGLDREKVMTLQDCQNNEALYQYFLITLCNALNKSLPGMFDTIDSWIELLFPPNLLSSDGILSLMISSIPEEDWKDNIQIIGWLHQYYDTADKKKIDRIQGTDKIDKNKIAAATQFFTPDWLVRYMVENSLGRIWSEAHPDFDKSKWKFYLNSPDQTEEAARPTQDGLADDTRIKPEEIKVIDPCMGSGHILAYAFDVLMQIYTAAGWKESDAVKSIIRNNLFGLDIADRVSRLAYFTIMMKARQYGGYLLDGDIKPNVFSIQDSAFMTDDLIQYAADNNTAVETDLKSLRECFKNAKEFGSLLIPPSIDYKNLYNQVNEHNSRVERKSIQAPYQLMINELLLPLILQADIMTQKYDAIITNPPFLGSKRMNIALKSFLRKAYPIAKNDTYAAYIYRCYQLRSQKGYVGMITSHTWLSRPHFEKLRAYIAEKKALTNLLFLPDIFKDANVAITAFILGPQCDSIRFYDLKDLTEDEIVSQCISWQRQRIHIIENSILTEHFQNRISPLLFDRSMDRFFSYETLKSIMKGYGHTETGNNSKFLRYFWEVDFNQIGEGKKWYIHAKGGEYRKWYGNISHVIVWTDDAKHGYVSAVEKKEQTGITWTLFSGIHNSFRQLPKYCTFNSAAQTRFTNDPNIEYYLLGLLNSKISQKLLSEFNPTNNLTNDAIASIPYIYDGHKAEQIKEIVRDCIEISRDDWNSFETSMDFKSHPLINGIENRGIRTTAVRIEDQYKEWEAKCNTRFTRLKKNEEELNRLFNEIYGMQNVFNPEVAEKDVTVHRANLKVDIKSLISYAVGCIFGRYSVDTEGICYAGGTWDDSKYQTIIPVSDNIIPVCGDSFTDRDITNRFIDFIEKIYGEATLDQNICFIANALQGEGEPEDIIRKYFKKDFYADHCRTYSSKGTGKCPIYWLFSSENKNLKFLIYMHRYQPDLLSRMHNDHIQKQRKHCCNQLQTLNKKLSTAPRAGKAEINKQIKKLECQSTELQQYDKLIRSLADKAISINLDDGVKVNYEKFSEVVAKVK